MIPYGRQSIGDDDIHAVVEALGSDRITQGPLVEEFEQRLAEHCGAKYAVVMSSGTAALHAAYAAIGLNQDDEIISAPMTFPATTNAVLWQGARPVFVDVEPETGNIDPEKIEAAITPRTKALVPIDYTGRPADLERISEIAHAHDLVVIEDACQALGASYKDKKIGAVSDMTVFSFHPVKSITTGEGGAALTNNKKWYQRMRQFITHGITRTDFVNSPYGSWYFEMQMLGLNYRLTDIQCALGLSQLKKLDIFIEKRRRLAERYTQAFQEVAGFATPITDSTDVQSAWHLYVIRLTGELTTKRADIVAKLRGAGIGANVHHIPVHYHPYYESLGYKKGLCPNAEAWYEQIISLPLYPGLKESEQDFVIETLKKLVV